MNPSPTGARKGNGTWKQYTFIPPTTYTHTLLMAQGVTLAFVRVSQTSYRRVVGKWLCIILGMSVKNMNKVGASPPVPDMGAAPQRVAQEGWLPARTPMRILPVAPTNKQEERKMTREEALEMLAGAPRDEKPSRINRSLSRNQSVAIVEKYIMPLEEGEIVGDLIAKRVLQVTQDRKRPH